MPSKWSDSLDHVDPTWSEGRDYQLVCGFKEDHHNHRVCSVGENSRKSNRFIPWRVPNGWPRPSEPGDWAWFLNLDTNEWEFIQFLGDRWFALTRRTCAEYFAGKKTGPLSGGWNKGLTNEPRGCTKPGYLWYNNGSVNTRVLDGCPVPKGFVRGRLFKSPRNDKGQFVRPQM